MAVACAFALVASACARPPTSPAEVPRPAPRHPLEGAIYAREGAALVDEAHLFASLAKRPYVLVGETHDSEAHHAFQARVVDALGQRAPRPVVMEHFRASAQPKLDAFFGDRKSAASELPARVGWDAGWGPFSMYAPIFERALAHGMPVVAGSFDKIDVRALMAHPDLVLPEDVRRELATVTFDDASEKSLVDELFASHCGHLPGDFLAPMALVQHARDALFALAMKRAPSAVLLAGKGHTRGDRGAPRFLPLGAFVSVALVEVEPGRARATDYDDLATHDFVVFTAPTPRDEDPCAAFRSPKPVSPASKGSP
jgi:uncharacterized iron-regulated protein